MTPLRIDIWSDIACPWCWVGKRRLEKALESSFNDGRSDADRPTAQIHWRAFELDPKAKTTTDTTVPYAERLARKYGSSVRQAEQRIQQLTDLAALDGLEMRFDRVRPTNTFDAHRVIHLGELRGKQDAMKERLLRAYMTEGEYLGDAETLVRLAAEVGLDAEEVRAVLSSDQYTREVRADESDAAKLGIHGVPFFLFDKQYAVEGAQPVDVLSKVLLRVEELRSSRPEVLASGEVCGPDGCEVPNAT